MDIPTSSLIPINLRHDLSGTAEYDCRETARGALEGWGGSPDWQSQTGRVWEWKGFRETESDSFRESAIGARGGPRRPAKGEVERAWI